MKEYEQKICNIINNAKKDVIFQAHQAYKQGYVDGKADTPFTDTEEAENKAYNRGLNDAWNVARKIITVDEDGYSFDALRGIFGESIIGNIFRRNIAPEAIAKIKEYEDKQKQKQDAEIKLGDEVMTEYAEHGVAVRDTYYLGADKEPFTLIWFGTHMSSCRVDELSKTGRHFSQITEVLKELRGAENDE